MIYEELANEKISIFGYSEPLVPYEKAMEACKELVKERKKALERIRELTVENVRLKESAALAQAARIFGRTVRAHKGHT